VLAGYNESTPAALMILQDGCAWVDRDDDRRTPIVVDNQKSFTNENIDKAIGGKRPESS
jgi:hypothetical protein